MRYTFKTRQIGAVCAQVDIYRNGVHVQGVGNIQCPNGAAGDRAKAARIARERIADLKQIDSLKKGRN